jgi:transcriptional regulator with XRE-family HTH domain
MKAQRNPQLAAVGSQIRSVRKAKGFSQEGFALRVGLARAYYGGVERGERNISALNLIRLASALGVEVGALFPSIEELSR